MRERLARQRFEAEEKREEGMRAAAAEAEENRRGRDEKERQRQEMIESSLKHEAGKSVVMSAPERKEVNSLAARLREEVMKEEERAKVHALEAKLGEEARGAEEERRRSYEAELQRQRHAISSGKVLQYKVKSPSAALGLAPPTRPRSPVSPGHVPAYVATGNVPAYPSDDAQTVAPPVRKLNLRKELPVYEEEIVEPLKDVKVGPTPHNLVASCSSTLKNHPPKNQRISLSVSFSCGTSLQENEVLLVDADYEAAYVDELDLVLGREVLVVGEAADPDWVVGICDGKTGLVPLTHVKRRGIV